VLLEQQMLSFLVSISAGCLAAFCFDVYKTFIRIMRLRKIALGIGDIIFWIVLAGLVFTLLLLSNGGEMRGFMLLGLALGVGIYIRVFGAHAPRIISQGFELIRRTIIFTAKVFVWVWIAITTPVKLTCFLVAWPIKTGAMLLRKITGFIGGLISRLIPASIKRGYKKVISPLLWVKIRFRRKKK